MNEKDVTDLLKSHPDIREMLGSLLGEDARLVIMPISAAEEIRSCSHCNSPISKEEEEADQVERVISQARDIWVAVGLDPDTADVVYEIPDWIQLHRVLVGMVEENRKRLPRPARRRFDRKNHLRLVTPEKKGS